MNNTKKSRPPAKISLPTEDGSRDVASSVEQPASNATRQLEKPRVRRKAQADQSVLQEKGANALPVSDYPLKVGPFATNSVDRKQRSR